MFKIPIRNKNAALPFEQKSSKGKSNLIAGHVLSTAATQFLSEV